MENISAELKEFLELLDKKVGMVAIVAPSFVVDFKYPYFIGKLRDLGFSYVVEVAAGASETNRQVVEKLKSDPKSRFIMSPCPSVVRLLRNKFPQLVKFLANTDTPMSATAKIVLNKYAGFRPVFIGPCFTKKIEAKEDYPELNILVLTYKELLKVLTSEKVTNENCNFDMVGESTRIYPMGGGLSRSAKLSDFLKPEEIREVNGFYNLDKALQEFENNKNIRVLDILFCEGGCIGGPGVISKDSVEERKKRVLAYASFQMVDGNCRGGN